MKFAAFSVACVLAVIVFSTISMASPASVQQQERDFIEAAAINDAEAAKAALELAVRAFRAARMSPFGFNAGVYGPVPPKRNSELINSLLGLPKVMNDAGKK